MTSINYCNDTYFRADTLCKDVTIALVGKYTKLEDAYASVTKALQHAAVAASFRLKIKVQSEESCLYLTNTWFSFLFA